ncbi:MAG: DUF4886 domain-containing protein, partial [Luteolibacter sp.]
RQGVSVIVEQVTHSGWSLAQHAKCDDTLRRIRNRHWDVVILQEQSRIPSQPVKRTFRMLPAVRQLANLARAHGAEAVLYQTWGYRDGDSFRKNDDFIKMTARVRDGYHEAASHAGDLRVLPVGDAWENAMSNGDGWDLFQADGMHPSRRGNQLTAAVLFRELFPSHENQALGIKQMPAAASANFSGSP